MNVLYETRVALALHLPPVRLKRLLPLRQRVQQVLDEVLKGDPPPGCIGLVHTLWRVRLVCIQAQNVPAILLVEVLIVLLELVSVK